MTSAGVGVAVHLNGFTAAGLAAAIPAVIGYNYFVGRVRHWTTEMENFALELANLVERRLVRSAKPF